MERKSISEPLYIGLYNYYKKLIEKGILNAGDKLPSIRKCAEERNLSRTTVEAAYMQLTAEGYVIARVGSGYYVNALEGIALAYGKRVTQLPTPLKEKIKYDFTSAIVDDKSFNFDIWRRYIKSALRNTDRLRAYGEVQGEYDLRVAISNYVREKRGVVCTADQIVIGAGVQTLLHMLCGLIDGEKKVGFTGNSFEHGKVVFEDRGFEIYEHGQIASDFEWLQETGVKLIYTSPSHTTAWGDVMDMKLRLALLTASRKNNCIIIEDDYDSEFNYFSRPITSLQGLDSGENVVYMSTFSKLLLPSIRLSFMILPIAYMKRYEAKKHFYNQTASIVEQIALCQFIRDGHLEKQIKKARKLYLLKKERLCETLYCIFGEDLQVHTGSGGFVVGVTIETNKTKEEIMKGLKEVGLKIKVIDAKDDKDTRILLLSCSGVSEDDFRASIQLLKDSRDRLGGKKKIDFTERADFDIIQEM